MFPMEIGSDYTQEQKNQMTLFLVSINVNLIMNKYSIFNLRSTKALISTHCSFWSILQYKFLQWRSQNAEKVTHTQRENTGSSNDSLQLCPFSKWELLLKERICSQRKRIECYYFCYAHA